MPIAFITTDRLLRPVELHIRPRVEMHEHVESLADAALECARLRLRPILSEEMAQLGRGTRFLT
jgi:hypothetical protein